VYLAKEQLDIQSLNWELLNPLLQETVSKLVFLDPYNAQTGPARRGDIQTMQAHEKMMQGIPKELYTLLSKSIIETYSKND
jgi:hypothetical protein